MHRYFRISTAVQGASAGLARGWAGCLAFCLAFCLAIGLALWALDVKAQNTQPLRAGSHAGVHVGEPALISLKAAFDAAWARQPEALALPARRDAVRAAQQAAQAWTPEPAALEVTGKTDRLNRNQGGREAELGIAVPIWLPGERGRSQALAEAEGRSVESRVSAAQLRVAASVREAWWLWQRARVEAQMARAQWISALALAADAARRQQAGELAPADHHQALAAVATAEVSLAQADATWLIAGQQLQALTGLNTPNGAPEGPHGANTSAVPSAAVHASLSALASAEPEVPMGPGGAVPTAVRAHPALTELQDQARLAQRTAALAAVQSRANPEVTLAVTRDRGAVGEAYQQSFTLGLRIPFGAGPRHDERVAKARGDSTEAEAKLTLELARLQAEREGAAARLAAARAQLTAAKRRAGLAAQTRGYFDKSFRLGETGLPTRLRVEAEAADAERQAALAHIALAAAISAQRQALGLLPE